MKLKYIIVFLPFLASAQSPLYQECSNDPFTQKLEGHMDRFLKSVEPEDTFSEEITNYTIIDLLTTDFSSVINRDFSYIVPICFYASSLRGKHNMESSQLYYCENEHDINPQRFHNNTGPCLSESYIQKLSSTFEELSKCFDLSDHDANILFEILNHESSFIPNAQSPTGARCIGQLTKDTVIELTAQLALEMYDEDRFDYISNNLNVKKCPFLNELTFPPFIETSVLPELERINPSSLYDTIKKIIREDAFVTCPLVSNPVRCLFYSFLYYKNSLNHFNKSFEPEDTPLPTELSENPFFEFKENLTSNELIVLNDEASSTQMIFISTKGAYNNGFKNYPLSSLQKVEVINNSFQTGFLQTDLDRFKKLSMRLSYSGGVIVTQFLVREFLTELKRNIANTYAAEPYKSFREQILNGQPIPFESLIDLFHSYIRSESVEIRSNWGGIRQYSSQVDRDIRYMNIQNSDNQNPIELHFQKIKEEELEGPIPLDWIGTFNQRVQKSCYQFETLK